MTWSRTWRASIAEGREQDYETFARDVSLPMFRQQDGFMGVTMARDGTDCTVMTLWRDAAAIAALDGSESYRQTVDALQSTGILTDTTTAEVAPIHLMDLGQW